MLIILPNWYGRLMLNLYNFTVISRIAVSAGKEVMRVYNSEAHVLYKADTSPLTEADLAADAVIRQELERYFPGVFILSEDSVSAVGYGRHLPPIWIDQPMGYCGGAVCIVRSRG